MGRPLGAFSNSTANRSLPQPRHNPSPGGKVCPRQGKRRHLAASSPRRPFLRTARALDSRSCGGISRARKGFQLESAPHRALRRTGTALTSKRLPDRVGALERFPSLSRHQPHNLFRHHCRPSATGYPPPWSQKPATSLPSAAPPLPPPSPGAWRPGLPQQVSLPAVILFTLTSPNLFSPPGCSSFFSLVLFA